MVTAFLGGVGIFEIMLILVVALLVFGNRLPEIAKQIGKGYLDFRKGLKNLEDEIEYTEATPVRRNPPSRPPEPGGFPGTDGLESSESAQDAPAGAPGAGPAEPHPSGPGPQAPASSPPPAEPGEASGQAGSAGVDSKTVL